MLSGVDGVTSMPWVSLVDVGVGKEEKENRHSRNVS